MLHRRSGEVLQKRPAAVRIGYISGPTIKEIREKQEMTQLELAEKIGVSDKTISKWETGKGLPDITMVEPLANALGISIIELFNGEHVINTNRSSNMKRSKIYVCPLCGNIINAMGGAVISCCGITLPALESEEPDDLQQSGVHPISVTYDSGEYYVVIDHPMTKNHYISFIAYVTDGRMEQVKLYPEGSAEARFMSRGIGYIYYYCNKHGLMKVKLSRTGILTK